MPTKLVSDFLKLVYDPYLSTVNSEAMLTQRKELTTEYLVEVHYMAELPHDDLEGICALKVDELFERLSALTSNFLSFRMTKKPIEVLKDKAIKA